MEFDQPISKIELFLQQFSHITGIWCCYVDANGEPFLQPSGKTLFCTRMLRLPEAKTRCMSCMRDGCSRADRSQGTFQTRRCHAGLSETVVPIIYRFERVGNVIFSSIPIRHTPEHTWESARACLRDLPIPNSLARAFLFVHQMGTSEIASCASMLLNGITAIYAEADPHAESCGLERRLENYIRANYMEKLTLEKIAKALSVGKTKLCSITAMHGSTVMTLVNEIRIEEAKRLMETTCMRISDISEQVGVTDPNYFSKLFRAYTGETPRAYQKRLAGNRGQNARYIGTLEGNG